jgi:hypothetical protein
MYAGWGWGWGDVGRRDIMYINRDNSRVEASDVGRVISFFIVK